MDSQTSLLAASPKRISSAQIFGLATAILMTLFVTVMCIGFLVRYEVQSDVSSIASVSYWKDKLPPEQQLWFDEGIEELNIALRKSWNKRQARNVLLYLARGISPDALAASRFRIAGNETIKKRMAWDRFPHLGRLKNSCSSADFCDPFTVCTALLGGVRTRFRFGGLVGSVHLRDCVAAADQRNQVKSVLQQAQEAGLRTGFVTSERVTGPAMAALYAHTPNTAWECDGTMPVGAIAAGCADVAQQLVRGATGRKVNVLMGGGRQALISNVPATQWDPIDDTLCNSQDNRNLMRDWQQQHLRRKHTFAVLHNNEELQSLNGSSVDYAAGIFANGNLRPVTKPNKTEQLAPQLGQMVAKSLEILRRADAGYLLVVEAGTGAKSTVSEQVQELLKLNAIVEEMQKLNSDEETLTLVVFTNGAYVRAAMDISAETGNTANAIDFTSNDEGLVDDRLRNMVTDTMVYTKGPCAYLLHGVHEETYMAYVISYALRMGVFDQKNNNPANATKT